MSSVFGFAEDRFSKVRELFEANLVSGADLGASFCATIDGEVVVDIWGGWADEAKSRPWERDTIVNVYSTTKTMTALTALLLADRGELDFAAPVARYWPEFAQNGKEGVKVSHLLAHSSGLSGWKEPMVREDLYDWDKACALLAAQAPFWEPGTAPGYHGITQGYLVGEVVRRITGKTLGTVFREELAEPLSADFYIGLPASEDARVADLIPPEPVEGPITELMQNVMTNPPVNPLDTRTREWRAAEIPAAGGHGNARSIARIQSVLANGGTLEGKRYLSEATCRRALVPEVRGMDLVLGVPAVFGLGYGLQGAMVPLKNSDCMFWGGYGGSLIVVDMQARAAFGYAMNKMWPGTVGDERSIEMIKAMWAAI